MLPTSTFAKFVAFEKRALGLPLAEAIRIVPNYFAGWKVKTIDVTKGGQELQAWLVNKTGKIDTISIQYVKGIVDSVTLGPGEWINPSTYGQLVPNSK
jgi:hypothetical protein